MAETPSPAAAPAAWLIGKAMLLPARRQLLIDGAPALLGARAFDLLVALVEWRDRVAAKDELLARVWRDVVVEENNLQVHVSALRKLLGNQAIVTVPGQGYRLTAPVQAAADRPGREAGPSGGGDDGPARARAAAAAAEPGLGKSATAQLRAGGAAAGQTAAASCLRSNLPASLPPMYGRDGDLAAVLGLLQAGRLVTVVGAGGIGKTTLAQAAGKDPQQTDADGSWLIELAPVVAAELVVGTVAAVLGLNLPPEASVDALAAALAWSRMLIILDNCEHLVDTVAALASALLRSAPEVRLLATSQEPLRVPGEQVYRLASLEVPADPAAAHAAECGAIALFAARARAADPAFVLDEARIPLAAAICRRLDGIPLAIELAAARLPLLGLQGLHDRLDERFRVLTAGARLALRRHQTLHAALDWSHGLLTADEQTVFRRLGVFVGSFGLQAAQEVACDATMDPWGVLDHLGAMVDKSLVVRLPDDPPRYRLLESNRAFALERLQAAGETARCMSAHATAMLETFEESRCRQYETAFAQRLEAWLPDIDNLRAALEWAAGPDGNAGFHIALAGASAWIWPDAGLRPHGMRYCSDAMARIDAGTPPRLAARLLGSWSDLAHPRTGEREMAVDRQAVELYSQLGEPQALFAAKCELARTLSKNRQYQAATEILQEAERHARPDWPDGLRARWLTAWSWVLAQQGQVDAAFDVNQELRTIGTRIGDPRLEILAMVYLEQSMAARDRWQESLQRGRELEQFLQAHPFLRRGYENLVLVNLSITLTALGEFDEACRYVRAAFPCEERAGRSTEMIDPLAMLALRRGLRRNAARLFGKSEQLVRDGELQRQLVERRLRERVASALAEQLDADQLTGLMREGEVLSIKDALELAVARHDS